MAEILPYLVALAMFATLIVLFIGIIGFATNNKMNAKHSNTLMRARVGLQAAAVALFALLIWLST